MAVTAAWFGRASFHLVGGDIDYDAHDIKVMLMQPGYIFDQDVHDSYADVAASEVVAGNGYTLGGVALGTKSTTYDAASNRTRLFAGNAVWTPGNGETLSAAHAIIYKDSGVDNTSWLMGYVNFGATISAMGAPFTISWDVTDGLLFLQTA